MATLPGASECAVGLAARRRCAAPAKDRMHRDIIARLHADVARCMLRWQTKQKAEIQALSSFGFQYLTNVYLPRKLQEGDWV